MIFYRKLLNGRYGGAIKTKLIFPCRSKHTKYNLCDFLIVLSHYSDNTSLFRFKNSIVMTYMRQQQLHIIKTSATIRLDIIMFWDTTISLKWKQNKYILLALSRGRNSIGKTILILQSTHSKILYFLARTHLYSFAALVLLLLLFICKRFMLLKKKIFFFINLS